MTRLNKHLALKLGISRRQADELIAAGRVIVNNQPARLGDHLQAHSQVTVQGHSLPALVPYCTIALNKPVGYVCSRRKQGLQPTIYELLPSRYHRLKPVGRLDKDSSGLILLTNDGDFAHQMTHPSFHKTKRYLVTLDYPLQPLHRQIISDFGVNLPDGRSRFTLERQHDNDDRRWIIQMSEGRNRQIRRTFAALNYTVVRLHRTNFGPYSLGKLKRGEYTKLTHKTNN